VFRVLENKDRSKEAVQIFFVREQKLCTTLNFAVTGKSSIPIQFQSYFTKFLLHSEKTQIHLLLGNGGQNTRNSYHFLVKTPDVRL